MQKTIHILVCLIFTIAVSAQKQHKIEHTFPLPSEKRLDLDLKFGTEITVNTWEKKEVLFKTFRQEVLSFPLTAQLGHSEKGKGDRCQLQTFG